MSSLTIVSGLINIGRGEMGTSFSRSFDHYKECFAKLLTVTKSPMVLYISPDLEDFVWQYRDRSTTTLRMVTVSDLKNMPFYQQIQKIRTNPSWFKQKSWLEESTQARLELYNPLVMSKFFWLNDTTLINPHNTKYFLWLDGGITNTVWDGLLGEKFEAEVVKYMEDAALFLCFPYKAEGEIHGFDSSKMNEFARGTVVNRVARGGLFGGRKEHINSLNTHYYSYLGDSLSRGLMGTEESIFTLLTYNHPDLCQYQTIGENGLIAPWIESILKRPKEKRADSKLGIYSVCFNLPSQYKLWLESTKNHDMAFKNASKYTINNSTDRSTDEEFSKLCKAYSYTEIKKPENLGICGARQLAAEMFEESEHQYMVFFEDDMMLCGPTDQKCRNGFVRYDPKLFQKCMGIMEKEGLDYLKLCFSEFFGDNHRNWSWHNLPLDKKQHYFPGPQIAGVCNRTKIDYTDSVEGLSYAVGDFHYCNWPVMFSKAGSKKVFLETKWASPFEQTWMSHVHQLISAGEIKAGCLFASTINHNRVYHYSADIRKENHHPTSVSVANTEQSPESKIEAAYTFHNKSIDSSIINSSQIRGLLTYLGDVLHHRKSGDVVELGCYVGESSKYLRKLLDVYNSDKRLIVYDSFQGLPPLSEKDGHYGWKPGTLNTTKDVLIHNFEQNGLKPPEIVEGWFKDIKEDDLPSEICFAFLDGDFYDSIIDSMRKIYDRMVDGGVILFHDWNRPDLPGVDAALRDFFAEKGIEYSVNMVVDQLGIHVVRR